MLIGGIALGLVLGLLAGGTFGNLGTIRLRRLGLLILAVFVRFGTELLLNAHVAVVDLIRLPLLAGSFGLLLALWPNRRYPGISLAFIGVLSNAIVIIVNGGFMPIWSRSLELSGLTPANVASTLHFILPDALDASFLLRLGPFADIIPVPLPFIQNVASVGDAFLTFGLGFFLFAAVVRVPQDVDDAQLEAIHHRLVGLAGSGRRLRPGDPRAQTGLSSAFTGAVALERPLVMGSAGPGLASPSLTSFEGDAWAGAPGTITIPLPSPEVVERVRQHPYVRHGSEPAGWSQGVAGQDDQAKHQDRSARHAGQVGHVEHELDQGLPAMQGQGDRAAGNQRQ